ncbi:putative hexosyltransferase MUCI70 [Drosera capensis]
MAQYYRQSGGFDRLGVRTNHHDHHHYTNGTAANSAGVSDHVVIGVRGGSGGGGGGGNYKQGRGRRLGYKGRRISIGTVVVVVVCLVIAVSVFAFAFIARDRGVNSSYVREESKSDLDFLTNVTRISTSQVKFGRGSASQGRDSRHWDGDDRRRDDDYSEESINEGTTEDKDVRKGEVGVKGRSGLRKLPNDSTMKDNNHQGVGLYNEAGRNELKRYEEKYEASLKNVVQPDSHSEQGSDVSEDDNEVMKDSDVDIDDEYDDGIDALDARMNEYQDGGHENEDGFDVQNSKAAEHVDRSSKVTRSRNAIEEVKEASGESLQSISDDTKRKPKHTDGRSNVKSSSEKQSQKRKPRRHKFGSTCEMKFLNSTAQLVEPLESRKFSRFSLQYTEVEEKPIGLENWEPRFAGHQSLQEREDSFIARDQKINCGFVKGPEGYPSTGFDLAEDDSRYMSKCHIAVASCIFGNSDRLRSPYGKTVSRLSRKNACFVMFIDAITLQTLTSDGQQPDRMGFIGIWKIVVVKNLPFSDMRRVGKIPKMLSHRLFPSARYSIWLDSKLRLQQDPLLILEYFLWRKGFEYAISNHYDRHCLWDEVAQNKKLNKYNHTIIEQQFAFYQADGLKRFNASDPGKLLPSNVPEGSFIIRAHTPMSNLFSCLWFNEVDRFTPRDQLSFAYTYQKLKKKNPGKPFYLNMFKDCERRAMAKLFHHRAEENRGIRHEAAE